MDRDDYGDMFRYRIGDAVRWAEAPHQRYFIGQRRWTQREILSPKVEYHLKLTTTGSGQHYLSWADEADLEAWKEETP